MGNRILLGKLTVARNIVTCTQFLGDEVANAILAYNPSLGVKQTRPLTGKLKL
jgi:hypothetical protein